MNRILLCFCVLLAFLPAHAQEKKTTPKPEIKGLSILGLPKGKSAQVILYGENLAPSAIAFNKPGVVLQKFGAPEDTKDDEKQRGGKKILLDIAVTANCAADVYDFTLTQNEHKVTGKFAVWEPAAQELTTKRPCNEFKNAMPLVGDSLAVLGFLKDGDSPDLFQFVAKAGETWEIVVLAGRAGSALDPIVRVRNAMPDLFPLAQAAGDERKDRFISFKIPKDGTYFIELADAEGQGKPDRMYRLTLRHK